MASQRTAIITGIGMLLVGCISEQRPALYDAPDTGVVADSVGSLDTVLFDNLPDGLVGDAAESVQRPCRGGCMIGGECRADGAVDPSDACAVCDPARDRADWSPARLGTTCDDGAACTDSVCDGAGECVAVEVTTGCFIDGRCYGEGTAPADSDCVRCEGSASRWEWTAISGASCDDGDQCTSGDVCVSGACVGEAMDCSDGLDCTADSCVEGTCRNPPHPGRCLIDGTCYEDQETHPANSCLICDSEHAGAWSLLSDGEACQPSEGACAGGVCDQGACVMERWLNVDPEPNDSIAGATFFSELGAGRPAQVVEATGQLNPDWDLDWYGYVSLLESEEWASEHYASLTNLPADGGYSLCLVAACSSGPNKWPATVSCPHGSNRFNFGDYRGCCVSQTAAVDTLVQHPPGGDVDAEARLELAISPACGGAPEGGTSQGFVFARVGAAGEGALNACGTYELHLGFDAVGQVTPPGH